MRTNWLIPHPWVVLVDSSENHFYRSKETVPRRTSWSSSSVIYHIPHTYYWVYEEYEQGITHACSPETPSRAHTLCDMLAKLRCYISFLRPYWRLTMRNTHDTWHLPRVVSKTLRTISCRVRCTASLSTKDMKKFKETCIHKVIESHIDTTWNKTAIFSSTAWT